MGSGGPCNESVSERPLGNCWVFTGGLHSVSNFFWSPVAFRRIALETSEWSRNSNHQRQSVSPGKTNAIPTEPSGRLPHSVSKNHICFRCQTRTQKKPFFLACLRDDKLSFSFYMLMKESKACKALQGSARPTFRWCPHLFNSLACKARTH